MLADVNSDGNLDIVACAANADPNGTYEFGGIVVLLGNGDGSFGQPFSFATGSKPAWLVVDDFTIRIGRIWLSKGKHRLSDFANSLSRGRLNL